MKNLFKGSILFNLFLIVLITSIIVFALFASLNTLTKHGQDAKVPNVTGKKLNVAMAELKGFELKVDSIYLPYKDPLEIIYQDPGADNIVKAGRIIFLTVNKQSPPTITMPALVNMSFRNAVLTLQSFRLIMGDTIFKPDIAAGAVLQQLFQGKPISSGSSIPVGSRIDLVVGAGLSDSTMAVPDLIGKSFSEVKSLLDASGILYNVVWEGSITDSNSAVIYNQQPESKNELDFENNITAGDMIDIRIMQRPSAELLRMNVSGSRKFLDPNDTNSTISYGPPVTELPQNNVDANGNPIPPTTSATASTVKTLPVHHRKPKPKNIKEEVNQILNNNNTPPPAQIQQPPVENAKPSENIVGPKPEPVVEHKPEPKPVEHSNPISHQSNTHKQTPKPTNDKTIPHTVPKKHNTDVPVKTKNKNDFSDEFK